MARPGVTREQVFETADALVREGQNPTIVSVRQRLGGGSPNTITPLLAEWKALHDAQQVATLPPVPEPVMASLRQVWGTAWQHAQGHLTGEREALVQARKAMEQERAEMLAEIGRLDGELEAATEAARVARETIEAERQIHERTRGEAREARALAEERERRIATLETERDREQQGRMQAETTLTALRIEVATLTERAAHSDELRVLIKTLQERSGSPQ